MRLRYKSYSHHMIRIGRFVVYTNTGVKASMTWLVLTLLGYDAKIYSWYDWKDNLPSS